MPPQKAPAGPSVTSMLLSCLLFPLSAPILAGDPTRALVWLLQLTQQSISSWLFLIWCPGSQRRCPCQHACRFWGSGHTIRSGSLTACGSSSPGLEAASLVQPYVQSNQGTGFWTFSSASLFHSKQHASQGCKYFLCSMSPVSSSELCSVLRAGIKPPTCQHPRSFSCSLPQKLFLHILLSPCCRNGNVVFFRSQFQKPDISFTLFI